MPQPDHATQAFEAQRPRLLRLAYRMTGSLAEAEDVVQDAWLRWGRVEPAEVREPAAWLTRTVTRLCLDVIKSARVRRETYVGSWLPEPLIEPERDAEDAADQLTLTLMMALERLSPLERAAFLLHDVFGLPFEEVGETLHRQAPAVRQLAARARQHVAQARPRFPVEPEEGARMAQAFFQASTSGDVTALRALLADGAVLISDGGGKVAAFLNPILGVDRIMRLYAGLYEKWGPDAYAFVAPVQVDGLPGYASLERGRLLQVTAMQIEDGKIATIYITRNPEKLARLAKTLGR